MADRRSTTVFLKGDTSNYDRALLAAAAGTRAFVRELDTSNDRMSNLVQTSLALGPALVPIGASVVPAVAGLTNQLALAAAAAGTAGLAFSGIGDALKATNDYAIDPTAANLDKMQQSLRELGPAGRDFVAYLQSIRPELQELQDAAQEGLLPGAEDGIRDLLTRLPEVERIISQIATAGGDLLAEAGDNLADPRWDEFFTFLETEARPTLIDMGRTLGNFTEGFAELWMAFAPVSAGFSRSFLDLSRDFSAWAGGLEETDGFADFVDYLNRVGPKAWDTLAALSNALLQIVEAAAPVGEAMLPVIEALADTVATIADSDAGPVLIGVAAGVSALSRSVALFNAAQGSALTALFGKSALGGAARAARDLPRATSAYLDYGAALDSAAPGAGRFASSSDRLGASLRGLGKTAGVAAGLAVVMSDLDNQLGLSNTAMLTLAGTAAGPWGAAIGASIGYAMDFANANDATWASIDRLNASLEAGPAGLEQQQAALAAAREELNRFAADADMSFTDAFTGLYGLKNAKNSIEGLFGESDVEEATAALAEQEEQVAENERAAQDLRFAEAGLGESFRESSSAVREQVDALIDAIDAHERLTDRLIGQEDASNAWRESILTLTSDLRENGTALDDQSLEGIANQDAIRDRVKALRDSIAADQEAGAGQAELARKLKRGRDAILDAGEAAGVSRKEMGEYLDTLGLTPESIRTRIILADEQARQALASLSAALYAIPGVGSPLVALVNVVRKTTEARAAGGPISGPGTATSDSIPALLSNGEHVWTTAEVNAAGGHNAMYALRAAALAGALPRFADGGAVGQDAVTALEMTRMRIRIRDLERDLRETERRGGRRRYVLRGLDRVEARQELYEARREYSAQAAVQRRIPRGYSAAAYNNRLDRAEDAGRAAESLLDLGSNSLTSAGGLERQLQQMVADSAEFTTLLAQLSLKKAPKLLLDALLKAGPSRATNRTARSLLTDADRFQRIIQLSTQAENVAGIYGSLTTDPRFATSVGANLLTASQQKTLTAGAQVQVPITVNPLPGMDEMQVGQMAGAAVQGAFR